MVTAITPVVHPLPNRSRHEWARWDAYIGTDDPDSLYTEFVGREVPVHRELANTSDGLRAFEITDNSGYVLCFGRPVYRWLQPLKVIHPVTCRIWERRHPFLYGPNPGKGVGGWWIRLPEVTIWPEIRQPVEVDDAAGDSPPFTATMFSLLCSVWEA